jgi:ketosteroid isomerase-like protein
VSLSLLVALAPLGAQPADPVREVLRRQDAATEAYRRNDAAAIDSLLLSLLADDFTLTNRRGQVTTKADDVPAARAREVRFDEFRNVDQTVRLHAGRQVAVVTGRTLNRGAGPDGNAFAQDLPFTDTLVRIGGRWRMAASHVSAATPPTR